MFLSLILSYPFSVFAFDYDFRIIASERIESLNNFWDELRQPNSEDDIYSLLLIYPSVDIKITQELKAYCELKTALYWDRETDEHTFEERTELFEGFIEWKAPFTPGATLQAGKIEFVSADGYILDKNSPGISIQYDLDLSFNWLATLKYFWSKIEEESYVSHLQYDHCIDFFERIGLFWVYFNDGDNGAGEILDRQFPLALHFESYGNWQYAGLELEKFLGRLFLEVSYIYQFGSIDLDIWRWERISMGRWVWREKKGLELDISAHLFDINLSIPLGENMSAKLFYLFATGDDPTFVGANNSVNFGVFFSIAPFIKKTSIFFNGGIDDIFTSDTMSLAGTGVAGLSVPGVTLRYQGGDRFELANTWALLMSQKDLQDRGRQYGWETDFIYNWYFTESFSFFIEADYLHLGGFFKDPKNDNIWKGVIGVDFFY